MITTTTPPETQPQPGGTAILLKRHRVSLNLSVYDAINLRAFLKEARPPARLQEFGARLDRKAERAIQRCMDSKVEVRL